MSELTWMACRMVDGVPIAELPDLQVSGLEQRMMDYTSLTAELPWDAVPGNWLDATEPMSAWLVLIQDGVPVWSGVILERDRELASKTLSLKLATWETYLDRMPVGDVTFSQATQTEIVRRLVVDWAITGCRNCLRVSADPSGVRRDRTYTDDADKSVLSCIQELCQVINGPEWVISTVVDDDGSYHPVLRVADRIGSTGQMTSFDLSVMTSFAVSEDWSSGKGANRVRAVSTADGDVRPASSWHTADDPARPVVPYSYTPSTSITSTDTLDAHAAARLALLRDGTTTVSFAVDLNTAPKLNMEWSLGDVVGWDASEAAERYPDRSSGTARVIGYSMDFTGTPKLTPILQSEDGGE